MDTLPLREPEVSWLGRDAKVPIASENELNQLGTGWRSNGPGHAQLPDLRDREGYCAIFFAGLQVASIDWTNDQPVSDVSEQESAMPLD
jgi:hypothetical protein